VVVCLQDGVYGHAEVEVPAGAERGGRLGGQLQACVVVLPAYRVVVAPRSGRRDRDRPSVGAGEREVSVGSALDQVTAFVEQSVVVATEQHEVGEVGLAAVGPVVDMVGIEVSVAVTAGEATGR